MTSLSIDRDVEKRLGDSDVRYTRGRRAVVAALAATDGPRSAAELQSELGDAVPLSSLYRSLAVLEEVGIVVPHFGTKNLTRYELAEWITGHHHHLVCMDCGTVEDVDVPPQYESEVRRLVDRIGGLARFSPSGHVLEIEGSCARCA
jgi:Fe2+ or Zn2+ uptake regulation protein